MSALPTTPDASGEKDALINALLQESAKSDSEIEGFLNTIEIELDKADAIPLPAPPRNRTAPLLWSGAIAAAIIAAIFAVLALLPTQAPPRFYSMVRVETPIWPGGCGPDLRNLELKRSGTVQSLSTVVPEIHDVSAAVSPERSSIIEFSATSRDFGGANLSELNHEFNSRPRITYYDAIYHPSRAELLRLRQISKGRQMAQSSPIPEHAPIGNPVTVISPSENTDNVKIGHNTPKQEPYTFKDLLHRKLPDNSFEAIPQNPVPPYSLPRKSGPQYGPLIDNPWAYPLVEPLSTFSTDVDTASWTQLRALIRKGTPASAIPNDAVRIEEMINYFDWDYPQPQGDHPFAFAVETAPCPWNPDHQLLRIGIQGKEVPRVERPPANLVFLLDVSGSMGQPDKLPSVKDAIGILVEELTENDTVTLVVYAGAEGVALPPTSGRDQKTILAALDKLESGGSTNGGAGIQLAYDLAKKHRKPGGINRVILCTDGDFNIGITNQDALVSLVEGNAKSGTYLSVMGFGLDNLNDAMLEEITNLGNGNYYHIDTKEEARKVLLRNLTGTLVSIAKDVKIQVEFNPGKVAKFRLIGYANRKLAAKDFANDEIDAGEIGSGHTGTALYEVIPGRAVTPEPTLRYQTPERSEEALELVPSEELAFVKLRYKKPSSEHSILMTTLARLPNGKTPPSKDFQFASSIALFGMKLRDREEVRPISLDTVLSLAEEGKGRDASGSRAEFIELVRLVAENP